MTCAWQHPPSPATASSFAPPAGSTACAISDNCNPNGSLYFAIMSVTAVSLDTPRPLSSGDLFRFWSECCENFLKWQRKCFLDREPSPEDLSEHNKRLNLLVRFTLHVYAQAADPDSQMPEALPTIAGRLKQLETWRTVIHSPLTEQEADEVIARAFPDEGGTGSAA